MSAKRGPGQTWRCQACNAPLIAAETLEGRMAPINVDPRPDGNILLFKGRPDTLLAGRLQARVFGGAGLTALRAAGVPLWLSHFASCPDADRFRHTKGGVQATLAGER